MWPIVTSDHHLAVTRVLASGRLTDSGFTGVSTEVEAFERDFAKRVGARHAVMCQSGTAAIHAALLALKAESVVAPTLSFSGTVLGARLSGIPIVWNDIDPEWGHVAEWTTDADVAIPVHLHGNRAPIPPEGRYRAIVEDCAQAFGTLDEMGRQVGTTGDAAAWSLNATKTLWAGEGGVLTTDNPELAADVRAIVRFGGNWTNSWRVGYNWKPDELRAALARASLLHVDTWIAQAREAASQLDDALRTSTTLRPLSFVGSPNGHKYRVRVVNGDVTATELRERLAEAGVETSIWQTWPLSQMDAFRCRPNSWPWHSWPWHDSGATALLRDSFLIGSETTPLAATTPALVRNWARTLSQVA